MSKHTPGPWGLEPNGAAYNLRSPDRASHFLILVGMVDNNDGEFEANAQHIVHCVNAHDDLVKACKLQVGDIVKVGSSAIAKAEGKVDK